MSRLKPPYSPLLQKPSCCAAACLQMIVHRRGFGLLDQEELARRLGVRINPEESYAFSQSMPRFNKYNDDEGINTVDSVEKVSEILAEIAPGLSVRAVRAGEIGDLRAFLQENVTNGNDVWVEYKAHELHEDDNLMGLKGRYIHDGLIESVDGNTVTLIDPHPSHQQRYQVLIDTLHRAIGPEFGKETGFLVVKKA